MIKCNFCNREIPKGELKYKCLDDDGFYTLNKCVKCKKERKILIREVV